MQGDVLLHCPAYLLFNIFLVPLRPISQDGL